MLSFNQQVQVPEPETSLMSILIENQNYDISIETMQGTKYVYNQNVAHNHHAVTKTTTKTITCHKYCKDKVTIQNNCHTEVITIQDNVKPLLTNHKLVFQTPQDTQHLAPTSSYANKNFFPLQPTRNSIIKGRKKKHIKIDSRYNWQPKLQNLNIST